jgi:hypothetical protein
MNVRLHFSIFILFVLTYLWLKIDGNGNEVTNVIIILHVIIQLIFGLLIKIHK